MERSIVPTRAPFATETDVLEQDSAAESFAKGHSLYEPLLKERDHYRCFFVEQRNTHFGSLDIFRGIAILLVFAYHSLLYSYHLTNLLSDLSAAPHDWTYWFFFPATYGPRGVALFFVISGFCIHLSHARLAEGWLPFYIRRFWRIYPPYLVALIFSIPLAAMGWLGWVYFQQPGLNIFSHFFLFHNFFGTTQWGINGPMWSVAVEVQLYLIYPLLLWIVRKTSWKFAMALTAVLEIVCHIFQHAGLGNLMISNLPFASWFSWSLGAYLAHRFLTGQKLRVPAVWIWLLGGVVVASNIYKPLHSGYFTQMALFSYCLMANVLDGETTHPGQFHDRGLGHYLAGVGIWSYSCYLLHDPILNLYLQGIGLLPLGQISWVRMLSCIPCWFLVAGVSLFFHRLVEKPSIAVGKEWLKRYRQRSAAQVAASATT